MDSQRRERLFKLLTVALSVGLVLLLGEGLVRLNYVFKNRKTPPPIEEYGPTGWRSRPNVDTTYRTKVYGEAHYTTDERGFRSFGDLEAEGRRILAIGDSFTQGKQISDGLPYYDILGAALPNVEVFAYGVGGSGTLQQLMALEAYFDELEPDLVLWQFSFNDLTNNDYLLESTSLENNYHMRRPYMEAGEVVFRHPDGAMAFWTTRFYLARRFKILLDGVIKRSRGTIEQELHLEHPDLLRTLETTRSLFRRGVELVDPVPVVAFQGSPLDRFGYEEAAFEAVCQVEGLHCVLDLTAALRETRDSGVRIDGGTADGHWNVAGHALAARHIESFLASNQLLPE